MNPKQVLIGSNAEEVKLWTDLALYELNKVSYLNGDNFVNIANENLIGINIAFFVRQSQAHKVTDLATTKIKLGFSGNIGNKGAALIRFAYEDTTLCFINCHLESGFSESLMRKRSN